MTIPKANLNLNYIAALVAIILTGLLAAYCLNVALISIQTAQTIDDKAAQGGALTINKSNLEKALEYLHQTPVKSQPEMFPLDLETSPSAQSVLNIEINNGSGIAEPFVAEEVFGQSIQVSWKNDAVLLDETVLVYNNGYKDKTEDWVKKLQSLGWKTVRSQAKSTDDQPDVILTLGKK